MIDKVVKIEITEYQLKLLKKGKAIVYKAADLGRIEISLDYVAVTKERVPDFLQDLMKGKNIAGE